MQFCKPILLSIGSLMLIGGICASTALAQPLSAKTELTSLLDADRLHLGTRNIDYARSILDGLLADSTRNNDTERNASYATDEGLLQLLQNDLRSAQQLCSVALEERKRICQPTDPKLADSYNALSIVALHQQDYALAEQYVQTAIEIEQKDPERNALRLSDSFDIMARIYLDEGNFQKAELPAVQAWKIRTHVLGAANPVVAQSLYTLSLYYAQKGDFANAQTLLQDSILYGDPLQKSTSLFAQSMMYAAQGNTEQSRKTFDEGVALKKAVLGDNNSGVSAFKTLYVKYLWNHQHWLDAIEMRGTITPHPLTQSLDLDGRLVQRSFMQKEIPQQLILKNVAMVATIAIGALTVMGLLLFAPQFMYLPSGTGLVEFLRATRREDLRPTRRTEITKTGLAAVGKSTQQPPQLAQRPNGRLGLQAERAATPQWKPEDDRLSSMESDEKDD
ncbi:MAG: tetratricopeptide repeat protein [Candidatus Melainabacteria bacterium]|nr:tetratricopeptide repeat protein [Candidatus Melainabacteria bacterium]